jgi:cytochrome c oxidase cbb3-type subunit III
MRRLIVLCAVLLSACNMEKRISNVSPTVAEPPVATPEADLVAGPRVPMEEVRNPYENNQQAISEGQRLFKWFNCAGCHATYGGGSIGPPLIDDTWIYGNRAANIYDTIVKGRPNGMPSFGGKIPSYQIWQLVAFVESLPEQPFLIGERKDTQEQK